MKPSEFFKGEYIMEITDVLFWDEIKDVDCILLTCGKRNTFYKHAYAEYKGKYFEIVFQSDKSRLVIEKILFQHIKEKYKFIEFNYISQELEELMVVDGI